MLETHERFTPIVERLETPGALEAIFATHKPAIVVHLAAQAGVRYSIDAPRSYVESNISGTFELLEAARNHTPKHLLIASTSSVYGANTEMPYREIHKVDTQMSFYAATKKATEAMAQTYAHLYEIPTTMFRFFTVYGPWGRPDMALFKFTKAMLAGEKIQVFNYGKHRRDFTYVDDIVEGVIRVLDKPAAPNPNWSGENPDSGTSLAPWRVYNIGNNSPVELLDYIGAIEQALGIKAEKELLPLQPGDVPDTYADVDDLVMEFHYKPSMSVKQGVKNFIVWFMKTNKYATN